MIIVAPLEIYCGDIPVSGVREGCLEWGMYSESVCLISNLVNVTFPCVEHWSLPLSGGYDYGVGHGV